MHLVSAGSNAQGQLATGDQEDAHTFTECRFEGCAPGQLPQGTQAVVRIACGANHTLVLLARSVDVSSDTSRELWGCGDGSKHQLGPSVPDSSPVFVPLDLELPRLGLKDYTVQTVAACWETSYVVLAHPRRGDVLLSMGSDDFGDLGVGGTTGKGGTARVHRVAFSADCLGTDDPRAVRVLSLATGPHHVVARLAVEVADGSMQERLVGWGTSRHGQLGDLKNARTGRPIPFVDAPHPVAIPLDSPLRELSLGNQHSVFLTSSGRVHGIGSNRRGQLNTLDHLQDVVSVGCTWNGTYVVTRQRGTWSVVSLGASHKGQLGRHISPDLPHAEGPAPGPVEFPFNADSRELIKVACGSEHVLCLFSIRHSGDATSPQHEVWAWGWNEHGTLGDGTTEDRNLPLKVWPPHDNLPKAVDVFAGCGNSWIVLEN